MGELDQVHRGARLLLAGGILVGGLALGSLFRRPAPLTTPAIADQQDRTIYGQRSEYTAVGPPGTEFSTVPIDATAGLRPGFGTSLGAGVLRPPTPAQSPPPPLLSKSYPRPEEMPPSRWALSVPGPAPFETSSRTHKILDGDTLAALAERYLGDSQRAGEIFEANRSALFNPDVLPIGVQLRSHHGEPRQSRELQPPNSPWSRSAGPDRPGGISGNFLSL